MSQSSCAAWLIHTHIPECNSSMTHNQILCRSNHPHPSLTTTLSHCIITLLQEKPATKICRPISMSSSFASTAAKLHISLNVPNKR